MKYFTRELLMKTNSEEEKERKAADEEWQKNDCLYCDRYSEIKNQVISKKSELKYMKNYGFHDFLIQAVEIMCGKVITIIMELQNPYNHVQATIVYKNVQQWSCNAIKMYEGSAKRGHRWIYMYDEFDIEGDSVVHRVLFNSENELEVVCKKIIIK